ncbi:MAG: inositol monophosphatase, partial [Polaromonas sp.]
GSLLVTEAGGLIGNFTGEADFMDQGECLAANPRIYGQLVATLEKYSKFAGAGDKATVRQALQDSVAQAHTDDKAENTDGNQKTAALPIEKPTLKAKRIKAAPARDTGLPDAPF